MLFVKLLLKMNNYILDYVWLFCNMFSINYKKRYSQYLALCDTHLYIL